jgi:ABC-type lipoprotein export system ATPase subunit
VDEALVNLVPLVKADGLFKSYRRGTELVHALREVHLTLGGGEMVALLGRSGSGKTTLLNLLAGWEQPTAGTISWSSELLKTNSGPPAWDEVAVMPQSVGLIEELTIRENIELPLRLAGHLDSELDGLEHIMESLGLSDLAGRFPLQTSLGQQQRAGVARALVVRPRLLLADEPTDQQDAGWAARVFEALRDAAAQGTCVLVATHTEEVTEYADRVVQMQDGHLQPVG